MRGNPVGYVRGAAVLGLALLAAGCTDAALRQGTAPVQLVVLNIEAAPSTTGSAPNTFFAPPLASDIPGPGEGYFNDFARVTLRAQLRDIGAPGVAAAPTANNDVTLTSYRVVYRRTDGRNTPGSEVPHGISGPLGFTIPAGGTGTIVFEIVRHNAKIEAPLATLGTNPQVLTTIAEVTFFGRDQAGNDVSVTTNVQINFASYA